MEPTETNGSQNEESDNEKGSVSEESDYEHGSHEPFDPFLIQEYQIRELKEELERKTTFEKHLMWHCLMYREALKRSRGGCKSLKDTISEFQQDKGEFPTCPCCEYEYYKDLLRDIYNKSQQGDSPQLDSQEKRCANCTNDAMMIKISELEAAQSSSE